MKTRNNIQKATLRLVAVIASFFLVSLTVSSQNFWRELLTNNSFSEVAVAMVGNSGAHIIEDLESENYAHDWFYLEIEEIEDNSLKIEDWMLTGSNFVLGGIFNEEVSESSLELEDWMTDFNNFANNGTPSSADNNNIEKKDLEIESWMLTDKLWEI